MSGARHPGIGEQDRYLFNEGTHHRLWRVLGAQVDEEGTHFAVWAPNARSVDLVGDFNAWKPGATPMQRIDESGIWVVRVAGVGEGARYKYRIVAASGEVLPLKADPFAFGAEHPPHTASVVRDIRGYGWDDAQWMRERSARNSRLAPISIYEVHLGSWKRRRDEDDRMLSYREAAVELVDYVAEMGFTHIEFLPLTEHPFDGSWGYQPIGLYAPTIRHGPPHEFRDLVDAAHQRGIGVILDWVPAHFPSDAHGLRRFDGTALYEHEDPRQGFHQDWNTLIFNYGRHEVANYLISSALYWLEEYHLDGLRVDAVASMLYLDYSREEGQWIPNRHGGRENLEAIALLQRMNTLVYGEVPGVMTIAEESTTYPGVSAPVHSGGLGFGFKWNMGWMNDTLEYIGMDPLFRRHHHHKMTFGTSYAFSENFVLPISHDEVVHGKGSMYTRMPGDAAQGLANLRCYYGFMWGHPGKKLLFMGCEFAQPAEWAQSGQLDWETAAKPAHSGVARWVRDLNALYREEPAMHRGDCDEKGFAWIEADDAQHSVYAWLRRGGDDDRPVVVVCNFTPVERRDWRLGLPMGGPWTAVLNSDAKRYGGKGRAPIAASTGSEGDVEAGRITAEARPHQGQPYSTRIHLPPLTTLFLIPGSGAGARADQE